jgi:hypothetical protein
MLHPNHAQAPDEPPPFLGTWPRVYVAVLVCLLLLIAFFAWFTATFQR